MPRSPEWIEEFSPILDTLGPNVKLLVLDGSIEICPVCGELSAYAWQDTTAYEGLGDIIPGGFKPQGGTIAHIPVASGFEWQCGHCGRHLVEADSPINHPAYTHSED